MNLKCVPSSQRSQTWKTIYYMILFILYPEKAKLYSGCPGWRVRSSNWQQKGNTEEIWKLTDQFFLELWWWIHNSMHVLKFIELQIIKINYFTFLKNFTVCKLKNIQKVDEKMDANCNKSNCITNNIYREWE